MDALTDWENYLHTDERDPIVQVAVVKGQFELILPFLDGNGRIGRMLIPLILYRKGVIGSPNFYISASLERDRDTYYDRLVDLSRHHDWNGWIAFFLEKVIEQADEDVGKARAIQALYGEMKYEVNEVASGKYAIATLDALFMKPVFRSSEFIEISEIPQASAHRILSSLVRCGLLRFREERSGQRPAVYELPALLQLVSGDARS